MPLTDGVHETIVPVVAEEVVVDKRATSHERVRVTTHVELREVDVDVVRARDEVDVERVPIGRAVERVPDVRVEGDTTVIPVVEEVVVVERRLVLREEIRLTKRRVEHAERVQVSLRRERAEVTRTSSSDDTSKNETQTRRGG